MLKITVYFESILIQQAATNYKRNFLNVEVLELSDTPHPAMLSVTTTDELKTSLRPVAPKCRLSNQRERVSRQMVQPILQAMPYTC